MHEHETDHQGRQICTTNGEAPSAVRAKQREEGNSGQHSSYIVLCEEERAKGFVRPYRDRYQHVGRKVCGKSVPQGLGISPLFCLMPPDHDGDCGEVFGSLNKGCGGVTTMGRSLSETYARDPKFYGATFCVNCNAHYPVDEFVWTADGQQVGS